MTCKFCGKEFDPDPNKIYPNERNFCSRHCRMKYAGFVNSLKSIDIDIKDLEDEVEKYNKEGLIIGGTQMKDKDLRVNGSGYKDPTAYKAIKNISNKKDYKKYWNELRKYFIDYRHEKTGSHKDGRYCVSISVTDLLKKMKEIERGED